MIFPTTYPAAVLLLVFSMLCFGSWVNTQKLTGKWRFELFYYDFALGAVVCAALAAFTLGSFNSQDLTFQDNLLIASRHAMAYAFAAGMVFNLGNMLLLGAIQVSGLSVAFPIAFALALAGGSIWSYFAAPQTNVTLIFSGAVLALAVIVVTGYAHALYTEARRAINKPLRPDPRTARGPKPPSIALAIVLSIMSGIFMSLSSPLIDEARAGEAGVSPYGAALLFAGGLFLATLIYSPFFINFPVSGEPVDLRSYFFSTKKQHFLGLLGGIVWMAGMIAAFVAGSGPTNAQPERVLSSALPQAAALIAAAWGLLVWKEFRGASHRVKALLTAMLVLFAASVAVVAVAPLYPK